MDKKQILVECMSKDVAQGILQDCLEAGSIIPSTHFRVELANENLTFEDAWHVLKTGLIYEQGDRDIKTGEWKYQVEGHETGGKYLAILFCFKQIHTALLITVFSVAQKRKEETP